MDQQLVITGTGLATVFGLGRDVTWRAMVNGQSGLEPTSSLVEDDVERGVESSTLRAVAQEAMAQASLDTKATRVGVVMGTTLHGIRGAGRYMRTGDAACLADVPAPRILRDAFDEMGINGPRLTTCAACASGLASVALGATMIRAGMVDVAIVGGYDPAAEYAAAGFASLRLVSPEHVRPFCRDRQGLRLGPGYAALVLERASDATARGQPLLAELLGAGETADAFHLTRPEPNGRGAARAIIEALRQAGVTANDLDLICAHGTGTPANDAAEHAALTSALGDGLATTPVIACKSHIGHTLGAAGAVELVLALQAMHEGTLPPVPGVTPGEVEFDAFDLVLGQPRRATVRTTLNLSVGFGGANACVVLGQPRRAAPRQETRAWEVAISGIGLIMPGAPGNDHVLDRLRAQDIPAGPVASTDLEALLDGFRLRRESEYSRLTIAAAGLALAEASVEDVSSFMSECGAMLGTAHGSANYSEAYYREIVDRGLEAGNPMLFAEGVPNAGAAQLSIAFGIAGGCQTIVGSRTAGLEALVLAAARVRAGEWRRAIVSVAEEHNDAVNSAYEACGLTGEEGGFSPATGAAAFVIERVEDVKARDAAPRAVIRQGWLTCARDTSATGLTAAVCEALEQSHASGSLVGSANGTWIDQVEHAALKRHAELHLDRVTARGPEMFAVTPIIRLGAAILLGAPDDDLTGLCVDPFGPVAAVSVRVN